MPEQQKTVLITGSTRGIGFAMAEAFASEGYRVILNGRKENPQALEQIAAISPDSLMIAADLSQEAEIDRMFGDLKKQQIIPDVLVCNSGISKDGLLLRMKSEDLAMTLQVNLQSAMLCAKHAARGMLRKKKGSIIVTSSVVALRGHEGQCAYAASKAGLIGFMRSLARELASRNIRVNAIAPGWIETEMTAGLDASAMPAIPMNRIGKPEEVAQAALFLAGDQSSYITGQVLRVDGGMAI